MSETDFVLFQNIVPKTEIVLYAICLTVFLYPFMTEKKERRKSILKKVLIVFLSYVMMYLIGEMASMYDWLCMIIVIALLVAASRFLSMERNDTFLFGTLFFSIREMSRLITESLNYVFSKKIVQGLTDKNLIYRNAAISYSITMVLRFILLFVMLCAVMFRLQKKQSKLCIKELCYLCLIPIASILFGNIIFRLYFTVKGTVFFSLYEQYPAFIGLVPLITALFYAGIVITVMSYQEMVNLQEEKEKYFVEQQQLLAIQERMGEVEQFYSGIRQMKHEMKNHLTNIKGLAESGSYEEMEQYISRMDESMNVFELTIKTGNAVLDVIVNDKQKAADKREIQFSSEFRYPSSDGYNAYDIGIIINNLLQNALEACDKVTTGKKYIILSGKQKKRFFLINVKNSFEGEVIFDKNTNLPISTKENVSEKITFLHGIGLSNVKREAAKYLGNMDIKVKRKEFSVTVLLQERSKNE